MTEEGFTFGSDTQKAIAKLFDASMKEKLSTKQEILKTLLPNYPPGCRRLTPGPGYLEAVVKDNVEYISQEIKEVTEEGIVTEDGVLHKVDAVIWATGFRVYVILTFFPPISNLLKIGIS